MSEFPEEMRKGYTAYLQSNAWRYLRLRRLHFDGYRCVQCQATDHLDIHHLTYANFGHEDIAEIITLCRACHKTKHTNPERSSMQERDRVLKALLKHQQEFYLQCERIASGDFGGKFIVAHCAPGTGKSAYVLIAAQLLIPHVVQKIAWFSPRKTLARQAAEVFTDKYWRDVFQHQLSAREVTNEEDPTAGHAAYVSTHQAVEVDADQERGGKNQHLKEFYQHKYALIIDEGHHIFKGSKSEKAFSPLVEAAEKVIILTGNIERHDKKSISFLSYEKQNDENVVSRHSTDECFYIEYDLEAGMREKVILPIEFIHVDGSTRFLDTDGTEQTRAELSTDRDALFTAINTEIAHFMLDDCMNHWQGLRTKRPQSQMLVVCGGIRQAYRMRDYLASRHNVDAQVATTKETDEAMENIQRFRRGRIPILVTVAMAYEGLDVQAITHLCCLTHIRSFPWIYQMFGRLWRLDRALVEAGIPYEQQCGYAWVPDDALMAQIIATIKEIRDRARGECGAGGGGGGVEIIDRIIVPLSSATSHQRSTDLHGNELSPAEYKYFYDWAKALGVDITPMQLQRVTESAKNPPPYNPTPPQPEEPPVVVPIGEEYKIKTMIKEHIADYEREHGLEWGAINTELRRAGWPPRSKMKNREDLMRLYREVKRRYTLGPDTTI